MKPMAPVMRKLIIANTSLCVKATSAVRMQTRGSSRLLQVSDVEYARRDAIKREARDPVEESVQQQPHRRSTSDDEGSPVPSVLLSTEREVWSTKMEASALRVSPANKEQDRACRQEVEDAQVKRTVMVAVVRTTTMKVRKRKPKA